MKREWSINSTMQQWKFLTKKGTSTHPALYGYEYLLSLKILVLSWAGRLFLRRVVNVSEVGGMFDKLENRIAADVQLLPWLKMRVPGHPNSTGPPLLQELASGACSLTHNHHENVKKWNATVALLVSKLKLRHLYCPLMIQYFTLLSTVCLFANVRAHSHAASLQNNLCGLVIPSTSSPYRHWLEFNLAFWKPLKRQSRGVRYCIFIFTFGCEDATWNQRFLYWQVLLWYYLF